jgi:hypothetical protein
VQQKLTDMSGQKGGGKIAIDEDADDVGQRPTLQLAFKRGRDLAKGERHVMGKVLASGRQLNRIAETVHQRAIQHLL